MKKKIFITLGILLVVIVGSLSLLVLNLGRVVNSKKDFFLSRAEQEVGRTITIDDIGLSIWGGLGIRLSNVTMSDDPAFSDKPFIEARELQVSAKFLPLLKKQFEIKQVTLIGPVIRVIRNEAGVLNAMTLVPATEPTGAPAPDSPGSSDESPGERETSDAPSAAPGASGPAAAFAIALVNIDDGSLLFEDRMEGLNLRVTQIKSSVTDLDPSRPISLTLDAAVFEDHQNLHLEAKGGPVSPGTDPQQVPFDATIEIGPIEATVLTTEIPAAKESLPPNLRLTGPVTLSLTAAGTPADVKVSVTLDATQASVVLESEKGKKAPPGFEKAPGIPLSLSSDVAASGHTIKLTNTVVRLNKTELNATATIDNSKTPVVTYHATSDEVALADFVPPDPEMPQPQVVKGLDLKGTLTLGEQLSAQGEIGSSGGTVGVVEYEHLTGAYKVVGKEATLESFRVNAYDGILTGRGTAILDPETPSYEIITTARGCDALQALDKIPVGLRKHVRGSANADLTVSAKGKDWASMQPTISGRGRAELLDGALIDLNFLNALLAEVTSRTGQTTLSQNLMDRYPLFKSKDAPFENLATDFIIENGKVLSDKIQMNTTDYSITGSGGLTFEGGLDMSGTILMTPALTAKLIEDISEAKYLTNAAGQIEIPIVVSGTLKGPRVDTTPAYKREVAMRVLSGRGANMLDKGLKNLFGKD